MNDINTLVLVYQDDQGNQYEQPAADITSAGTLIDPDNGDDLVLIGWRTV